MMAYRKNKIPIGLAIIALVLLVCLAAPTFAQKPQNTSLLGLMSDEEMLQQSRFNIRHLQTQWDMIMLDQQFLRRRLEMLYPLVLDLLNLQEKLTRIEKAAGSKAKKHNTTTRTIDTEALRNKKSGILQQLEIKLKDPVKYYDDRIKTYDDAFLAMLRFSNHYTNLIGKSYHIQWMLWKHLKPHSAPEPGASQNLMERNPNAFLQEQLFYYRTEQRFITGITRSPDMVCRSRYEPGRLPNAIPKLLLWFKLSFDHRKNAEKMHDPYHKAAKVNKDMNDSMKQNQMLKEHNKNVVLPMLEEKIQHIEAQWKADEKLP